MATQHLSFLISLAFLWTYVAMLFCRVGPVKEFYVHCGCTLETTAFDVTKNEEMETLLISAYYRSTLIFRCTLAKLRCYLLNVAAIY